MRLWKVQLAAIAFAAVAMSSVRAEAGCCAFCGETAGCRPVCRLVWEEQTIETTCYGCKREDFCVPGCSSWEYECEGYACQDCATHPSGVHTEPRKISWKHWCPGKAKIYTRTKLMKKVDKRKVPGFKWVVEDLCPPCIANYEPPTVPEGAEVPPPPPNVRPLIAAEPKDGPALIKK